MCKKLHKFTVATSCGRQNQSQIKQFMKLSDPFPVIKERKTNKFEDTNICLSRFVSFFDQCVCMNVCVVQPNATKAHDNE